MYVCYVCVKVVILIFPGYTSSQTQNDELKKLRHNLCYPYTLRTLHRPYCTKGLLDKEAAQTKKEHDNKGKK